MSDYSVFKTLDYKGLKCPMPIVKISQEMPKLKVGDVVEVLTTDPGSLSDFPAWAKSSGNEVLETKQETGLIRIFVRRKK
ncbi:MAG: sulfurtransferase TusA family protein [Spirochaetaceae bacterium]|nr:sulfurtransferase TusA family protein [Spirochaetaceae bacterium]